MILKSVMSHLIASEGNASPYLLSNTTNCYLLFYVRETGFTEAHKATFSNLPEEKLAIVRFENIYDFHFYESAMLDDDVSPDVDQKGKIYLQEEDVMDCSDVFSSFVFRLDEGLYEISCERISEIESETSNIKQEILRVVELL